MVIKLTTIITGPKVSSRRSLAIPINRTESKKAKGGKGREESIGYVYPL